MSRCVYSSAASYGDPCLDTGDCNAVALTCNAPLGVCTRTPGQPACYSAGACGPGTFCNLTLSIPGECIPLIATGGACVPTALPGTPYDTNGGCAATDVCYNSTVAAQYAASGICTRLNALPAGATFSSPPDQIPGFQDGVAEAGALLCASGLAVPLSDAQGFATTSAGRCVASLSLSQVGQACPSCSPAPPGSGSGLPLFGDGSLVCAPLGVIGGYPSPCVLYPSGFHTPAWAALQVATAACVASAQGPSGVPCARGSTATGRCAYFACTDLLTEAAVLSATGGDKWPLWFSPPLGPQCARDVASANALWRGALSRAALCNVTLPSAFAALNWTCGAPASFSLSPTPSNSPTPSPSAVSPTQSPSPVSLTQSPSPLSPTASPSQPTCPALGATCSGLTSASQACTGSGSGSTYWPAYCNYSSILPGYFNVAGGVCVPVPQTGFIGVSACAEVCPVTRRCHWHP